MKRVATPLPQSSKAFALLTAELTLLAAELREFVAAARPALTPAVLAALKDSCHRAKGGSGFFGLTDIAELVAELENLFLHAPAELEQRLAEVRRLSCRFEEALRELGIGAEKQGGDEHA